MCGEEQILTLVELGQRQETANPEEAAKSYLQAADLLLEQSQARPERENEYVAVANKLYLKAKKLKNKTIPGNLLAAKDNKIGFKDIGGLEELKEEIRFKIIEPFRNPDLFRYYGKQAGGGILMYGPPGCGKSLIAKATATEAKVNFIHVKGSDIKSKYVGETEKNIADLFQKAREAQPAIIFFDEFEALGGDRTEAAAHERSAVAQLLTEMDGVDTRSQQILLLAATNEPWSIDPALRREGRFGTSIFIPPPDQDARRAIFQLHMSNKPTNQLDYDSLAEETAGLSGADLKSICEMAADIPLKESFITKKRREICREDVETAIMKVSSVLKQWFAKAQEQVVRMKLEELFPELMLNKKQLVIMA